MAARAFWIAAPGRGEIRSEALPEAGGGDVVVRTLFSGVSRGTEALVFNGRVPATEHDRMRAPYQQGAFPAPVKYGYANVGVVESGDAELNGRTVFALFPHQTRYVVPHDAVHIVPEGVPPARAVLAANMETAINVLWDADVRIGDRLTIVGGGTVGLLAASLAGRIAGTDVELVDVDSRRSAIAAALGARYALPEAAAVDRDVVLHTSGTPAGLALALRIAGFEATIVEASWYGTTEVSLALGEDFHARRLTIKSSQVGAVAGAQRARWSHNRRLSLALELLRDDRLDRLITGESEFDALPAVMAQLANQPDGAICHRIRYPQERA